MKAGSFTLGDVTVERLILGPIETNVYLVSCGDALMVVDPGDDCAAILEALDGRVPQAIVVTHCHFDHTGALKDLKEATGAPVVASAIDAPVIAQPMSSSSRVLPASPGCDVDVQLQDGETFALGQSTWQVLITPGHTKGSMCLFLSADQTDGEHPLMVSGDTLFAGAFGRTDFEGGSVEEMAASLDRLSQLPGSTVVMPGHGGLTDIEAEKRGAFRLIKFHFGSL